MIKAVIFDWDKTLGAIMGEASDSERLAALYHQVDYHFTPFQLENAVVHYQEQVSSGQLEGMLHPQKPHDIIHFYRSLGRILGHELNEAAADRLYRVYPELPFDLFAETRPALVDLQASGYIVAIITNHLRAIRPVITELVGDLVPNERVIISEEFGQQKPAPAIFHHMISLLNIDPSEAAYVGDNYDVDALGSRAAGYSRGIWYDRQSRTPDAYPDLPENVYRIESLSDVKQCLD